MDIGLQIWKLRPYTFFIRTESGKGSHDVDERRGRSLPPGHESRFFLHHDTQHDTISVPEMAVPQLAVLKTKAESRALAETLQVWTVELPVKAANNILMYDGMHLYIVNDF